MGNKKWQTTAIDVLHCINKMTPDGSEDLVFRVDTAEFEVWTIRDIDEDPDFITIAIGGAGGPTTISELINILEEHDKDNPDIEVFFMYHKHTVGNQYLIINSIEKDDYNRVVFHMIIKEDKESSEEENEEYDVESEPIILDHLSITPPDTTLSFNADEHNKKAVIWDLLQFHLAERSRYRNPETGKISHDYAFAISPADDKKKYEAIRNAYPEDAVIPEEFDIKVLYFSAEDILKIDWCAMTYHNMSIGSCKKLQCNLNQNIQNDTIKLRRINTRDKRPGFFSEPTPYVFWFLIENIPSDKKEVFVANILSICQTFKEELYAGFINSVNDGGPVLERSL